MDFSISLDGEMVKFHLSGSRLEVEGYDLENEIIASLLAGENSFVLFWQCAQVLLEEVGEEKFVRQIGLLLKVLALESTRLGVVESGDWGLGEIYFATRAHFVLTQGISNTKILDLLGQSSNSKIREYVAININTSPETLDRLSRDRVKKVVAAMADNQNANISTIERLSQDPHYLYMTLGHPKAHKNIHPAQVGNSHHLVRIKIAQITTSPDLMHILSRDEHRDVRYHICMNPHVPQELLEVLCRDKVKYIALRARANIEKLGKDGLARAENDMAAV